MGIRAGGGRDQAQGAGRGPDAGLAQGSPLCNSVPGCPAPSGAPVKKPPRRLQLPQKVFVSASTTAGQWFFPCVPGTRAEEASEESTEAGPL